MCQILKYTHRFFYTDFVACKNLFVDVQYDFSASTFTCNFLNKMDISIKYCSIVYGDCDQGQIRNAQGNSVPGSPNTVTLTVMTSSGSVCYTAETSNGSFTLVVEGRVQSKCIVLHHTTTNNYSDENGCVIIIVFYDCRYYDGERCQYNNSHCDCCARTSNYYYNNYCCCYFCNIMPTEDA